MHAMEGLERVKAAVFKALSDPARLKILELLRGGERCVCEIIPYVGKSQPLVSRHLAILKRCGLVRDRRDGNRRLYSVTNPAIFKVVDAIDKSLADALIKQALEQIA
jgi:DNA-binding transcriptional ArsR family regulator